MADAWKRKRELRELQPTSIELAQKKKKAPVFTKLDFTALAIAEQLRTPSMVVAYVQEKGSPQMQLWVSKNQHRLKELLRHAQEWNDAPVAAQEEALSDWAIVLRAAQTPCACPGNSLSLIHI